MAMEAQRNIEQEKESDLNQLEKDVDNISSNELGGGIWDAEQKKLSNISEKTIQEQLSKVQYFKPLPVTLNNIPLSIHNKPVNGWLNIRMWSRSFTITPDIWKITNISNGEAWTFELNVKVGFISKTIIYAPDRLAKNIKKLIETPPWKWEKEWFNMVTVNEI